MKPQGGTALTDEGRQARLDALLSGRFRQRGTLHLPSSTQYNSFQSDEGLASVTKDMCRWLGIKPNGLQVHYDATDSGFELHEKTIVIDRRYKSHPYAVGALLALAAITYFIDRYDDGPVDRSFVEYTALHAGLGIWIINALSPKTSRLEALYHAIDGRWFHNEGITLQLYTAALFASDLAQFAHANRIAPETYLPHISPRSRHLLPALTQDNETRSLTEPLIVNQHYRAARLLWTKIGLVIATFTIGTTAGVYFVAQRQAPTDPIQIQAREQLDIIKQSLDICVKKASDQESSYDPNDLFMTRQIDATKTRCESLRNQYNYALGQYRDAYTNQ